MSESNQDDFGGLPRDVAKLLGFGRARAIADGQRVTRGEKSRYGLTPDDFRCPAEQVEVDLEGKVTKSPPQKTTQKKLC